MKAGQMNMDVINCVLLIVVLVLVVYCAVKQNDNFYGGYHKLNEKH